MRVFSYKNRPFHLGPFPLESLARSEKMVDLQDVPPSTAINFHNDEPGSIINAMRRYQAMLDAIRDGLVKKERAIIPDDPLERAQHLKSFGYYQDASQAGTCRLSADLFLAEPYLNPDIDALAEDLRTKQTKTLAAGIDVVMAELKDSMEAPPTSCKHHRYALVYLYEYPRDPGQDEPGCEWLTNSQAQRACLLAAETAAIVSNYIRLLGFEARGHTGSSSDVDLNKLAVAAGLATLRETEDGPALENPYLGRRFGVSAVTTTMEIAADQPLAPQTGLDRCRSHGPAWWMGYGPRSKGYARNAFNVTRYAGRKFKDGLYPFEKSKRVAEPTTYIDEPRVPRVPKRTDMFARALFGDMGKHVQDAAKNGNYVRKSAAAYGPRRPLAAFVLLQDGPAANEIAADTDDPQRNADNIKAALYFLGADAVGISRCPDWAYYSHDAIGEEITPYHENAISVIIDQGHETMDGASGDDWIACSQSMRAYLRFSLLGGVIGDQIRNLGYGARVHSVMDGEVLQPPLLLLAGLGEVSRIGEVILNPYLGPRLKSGVITTNMPLAHDQPIDFGLQNFCKNCNKCARECPAGAITAGPKLMFNGYETYKSDSQKCTQYRITNLGGAMCGRCMKTCPWNLEGLFAEAPFRWAASHIPRAAKLLATLDDKLGNGTINPMKKWWWDIGMVDDGPYAPPAEAVNKRGLETELDLKFEDQTLAVYPANLAPHPHPFPFPMDREAGIEAYKQMIPAEDYRIKVEQGQADKVVHHYQQGGGESPVLRLQVSKVEQTAVDINKYEFTAIDGQPLPEFTAGAHLDVVVSPDLFRQYSLAGNPADQSKYEIAVLKEDQGRGGSQLLHKIFNEGRRVFVSKPINHFPLDETASYSLLMGGGIGITPMIAMAHRLHQLNKPFALHYSCKNRAQAAYLEELESAPWADRVNLHFSEEGTRADLARVIGEYQPGSHLYTCGPDRYMSAVLETSEAAAWPEESLHREYFSVPDAPDYVNHDCEVELARSGQRIQVPAEQSIAEALLENGVHIDLKCSDGLCGVCQCGVVSGEVEHRDYVLSKSQREHSIITCQSRPKHPGDKIVLDL
ncbi:MAG: 2Fe-2S iron-sulfur cluster-binding protein [Pseudomonadota bacterium]